MSTSWNPFGQDQKEGLPLKILSLKDPDASGFGLGSFQEHGVSPRGLTLLLETVPGDTADRSHQISSTVNAPAAPIPDSEARNQVFWLIKHFQGTHDLRPPSGDWRSGAASASPHPAAVSAI